MVSVIFLNVLNILWKRIFLINHFKNSHLERGRKGSEQASPWVHHVQFTREQHWLGRLPTHSRKSTCSVCLPTKLATNSLLLTGSFANNKRWMNMYFVCYIHYMLYSHNKVSCRKENDERKYILQYLLKTVCMEVARCSSNPCCSQVSCTWYLPGKWGSGRCGAWASHWSCPWLCPLKGSTFSVVLHGHTGEERGAGWSFWRLHDLTSPAPIGEDLGSWGLP